MYLESNGESGSVGPLSPARTGELGSIWNRGPDESMITSGKQLTVIRNPSFQSDLAAGRPPLTTLVGAKGTTHTTFARYFVEVSSGQTIKQARNAHS